MPSKTANLCRFTTSTVGAGAIAVGAAVLGFFTPAQAGIVNGNPVSYSIKDGINSECGEGVYSSAGPTLTRATIYLSSAGGGTPISLSGAAQVILTPLAENVTLSGALTLNKIPKSSSAAGLIDSLISDNGTTVTIGGALTVSGNSDLHAGAVHLPSAAGDTYVLNGTGDGASYSTYNFAISGWWGMALKDYAGTVHGVYDFRTGNLTTDGHLDFKGSGVHNVRGDLTIALSSHSQSVGVTPGSNFTTAATARQILVGETTDNSSYKIAVGYYLKSGATWTGVIQATAVAIGTDLEINPIGGSVMIGTPTGGGKGDGTLNVQVDIYDNGTASTGTAGSGYVRKTSPTLTTPNLGTPSAIVLTNATGTAAGLTAGHVTTNANLTGPITSVGNATTVTVGSITNAMLAGSITSAKLAGLIQADISGLTTGSSPTFAGLTIIGNSNLPSIVAGLDTTIKVGPFGGNAHYNAISLNGNLSSTAGNIWYGGATGDSGNSYWNVPTSAGYYFKVNDVVNFSIQSSGIDFGAANGTSLIISRLVTSPTVIPSSIATYLTYNPTSNNTTGLAVPFFSSLATQGTSNIFQAAGFYANYTHNSTGTLGAGVGFFIDSNQKGGSAGAITTNYGLYIGNQTIGTNNFAIYTGSGQVHISDHLNVVGNIYDNSASPSGTAGSGYVRSVAASLTNATLWNPTLNGGLGNAVTMLAPVNINATSNPVTVTISATTGTGLKVIPNVTNTLASIPMFWVGEATGGTFYGTYLSYYLKAGTTWTGVLQVMASGPAVGTDLEINPFGGTVSIGRVTPAMLDVNGSMRALYFKSAPTTYAGRPGSPAEGDFCNFSDSNTAVWRATIAGGGANKVMGRYDGTNWTVVG